MQGDVAIANEELIRSKDTLQFTTGQVKKGYASQNELDASRVAAQQATLKLRGAEELLHVLQNFTFKRNIAELNANAKESERELARVRLKALSAQTQCEKEANATKLTYDVEREKLARLQTQIEACTIRAPQDGEVVYANMSNSGRRSDQPAIEAGTTVRERQAIINLPDIKQMKVDCRIHESLIGSIRKGLRARIRVDAYPDEIYFGEISHVSSVPMSGNWPNTDLREYQTEVRLTDGVDKIKRLRPGLTSQVEVLVDSRENVLQVPIQSVVTVSDKQVAFVFTGTTHERRYVKLGAANQSHLEILEGLNEGDKVIMNPRSQFSAEIAALESELNTSNSKNKVAEESNAAAASEVETPTPTPPAGGPPRESAEGAGAPRRPGGETFFARLDTNKDGFISQDEAPEMLKGRFSELDKDADGKLSREEMPASRPPQQAQPQPAP
ncbi:HlyD family efflux transporter periplasmic adaptor subunit [Planctomicrobium sp. SH527]|uniref:HlyD family efflux transporter periplasmic adaptor subunit n=1 Tax=Planctomicrobium sp. SH527 TaxID=3448123 RepID=UPI003F5CAE60